MTEKLSLLDLINRDLGLPSDAGHHSEEELIDLLADRVAELLATDMVSFMSMMYRLDVPEKQVARALSPANDDPANVTLAKLIIERQKKRLHTKKTIKPQPFDDWIDFD